jgi:hypothetical protein
MGHPLRSIIAINDTENVSEDWNWFLDDIRKACEGTGILVVRAPVHDLTVRLGSDQQAVIIDLSEYQAFHKGYLFVETGRRSFFQAYDQSVVVLEEASRYFGISL